MSQCPTNSQLPRPPSPETSKVVESAVAAAEAQLRDVRERREAMREEWDTLMSELGDPTFPTEEELERMIRELPAQERAELRRFHDETQALKPDRRMQARQLPARATENLRINRHTIRC